MHVSELEDYCEFNEDRVYLMMAIARKKENPEITSSGEIVFREVVKNTEDIARKKAKLENTCSEYADNAKFRLYMSVNARNTKDAYFRFRERTNKWSEKLHNGEDIHSKFKRVDSHWKSELQKPHSRDETYFLYDLDTNDVLCLDELKEELRERTTINLVKETPNGWHIVVDAFNHTEMPKFNFDVERHNDRMFFIQYI